MTRAEATTDSALGATAKAAAEAADTPSVAAADTPSVAAATADSSAACRQWTAFLLRRHRAGGGDADAEPQLAALARRVWEAIERGDSCAVAAPDDDRLGTPNVGTGHDRRVTPLVFDLGHVYLHRLWYAELTVAQRLAALARPLPVAQPAQIESLLAHDDQLAGLQRRAISLALQRGLTVISGGPGTGKTFTLARILRLLATLQPLARVAVAAPTGKAAARLGEALRQQLASTSPRAGTDSAGAIETMTLHRLLGARGPGTFDADQARRLPYEVIVVDEASMIDVEMARRLLQAVGDESRLILAGDRDQLSSVEPGSVFAEIIGAQSPPIRDAIVRLDHNHRQADAPGLSSLAQAIRDGRAPEASYPGVTFAATVLDAGPKEDAALVEAVCRDAVERYRCLIGEASDADGRERERAAGAEADAEGGAEANAGADAEAESDSSGGDPADRFDQGAALLRSLARFRVLCAQRRGARGVEGLNRAIDRRVRAGLGVPESEPWYPGRLVIVLRNSPALGLANGDIGVCVQAGEWLAVAFESADGLRRIPVAQMPACDDAWAMTVHQSQGSEFQSVSLLLAPAGHALNTRELIYTGVTRARSSLTVWAGAGALAEGIATPTRRVSCLARRLA